MKLRITNYELRSPKLTINCHSSFILRYCQRKTTLQRGFTLTELLVVISIIGILTGLVSINYATARAKARDHQRQSDLATVASALELYRSDNHHYPIVTTWASLKIELSPRYLGTWPTNPKGAEYIYATNAASPPLMIEVGERYYVEIVLERPATPTITTPNFASIALSDPSAFQSGFWRDSGGTDHYRLAGR